jgi:hypothetical protein
VSILAARLLLLLLLLLLMLDVFIVLDFLLVKSLAHLFDVIQDQMVFDNANEMIVEHVDDNQPNQTVQQDIVEKVEQQLGVQIFDFVVREVVFY